MNDLRNDVFISYSRRDSEIMRRMYEALNARGFSIWVDWDDIPKGRDWLDEIYAGIENGDSFVCIVSLDFMKSEICHYELAHALKQHKRVIPVIYHDVTLEKVGGFWIEKDWEQTARTNWNALRHINWLFFRETDDFDAAFEVLVRTLQTDIEYVREHTRILQRTLEWEKSGHNAEFLLRGDQLQRAETWLTDAESAASSEDAKLEPRPTALQREYLKASRHAEETRKADDLRMEQRARMLRRAAVSAIGFGALALVAMLVAMWFGTDAVADARNAQRTVDYVDIEVTQAYDAVATSTAHLQTADAQLAGVRPTLDAATATLGAIEVVVAEQMSLGESLRLANTANGILVDPRGNAETAALLSIRALKAKYTPEADQALVAALGRLFTVQTLYHEGEVFGAEWSPDGTRIVTIGGYSHVWDATSGEILYELPTESMTYSVAWSPDGTQLVTGYQGGMAHVWDAATGTELLALRGHTDHIFDVAWSPDGTRIATVGTDLTARVWDAATGEERFVFSEHSDTVRCVAWSPDSARIASGSADGTARIWDATTGTENYVLEVEGEVDGLAWSLDGDYLITGYGDSAVIWDVESGTRLRILSGHSDGVDIAWSPDGTRVLTGNIAVGTSLLSGSQDGAARIWNVEQLIDDQMPVVDQTDESQRFLTGHKQSVSAVGWSPDGTQVLTGSYDGTARIWSAAPLPNFGSDIRVLAGHTRPTASMDWSPDGTQLVTGGYDHTVRIWDMTTGTQARLWDEHEDIVYWVVWSPDGSQIITADHQNVVRIWDAASDNSLLVRDDLRGGIASVDWTLADSRILTVYQHQYQIVDPASGEVPVALDNVGDGLVNGNVVAWSPDGSRILMASWNTEVLVWDTNSGQYLLGFDVGFRVTDAAWSPDGSQIVVGGDDGSVNIWNAATGELRAEFEGYDRHVSTVRWSPDGERVLSISPDGAIVKVWEASTGAVLRTLLLSNKTRLGEWSPDSSRFVTGSSPFVTGEWDHLHLNIWYADVDDLLDYACQRVFRDLTREERQIYEVDDTPTCPGLGEIEIFQSFG